jgi:7-cyano-7-deazaguanine synthase in queuosine biosynthesis
VSKMYKSVLLMSGGIDSFIGYYLLGYPQPVYFNLNSKYSKVEINTVHKISDKVIIDNDLNFLGRLEDKDAHIPYRNLFFMLLGVTKYSDTVIICGVRDDNVSDKDSKIFRKMSDSLSYVAKRKIEIVSPFWNFTKADICAKFANKFDKRLLLQTYSCYSGKEIECGACPACFRKRVALFSINIFMPFNNDLLLSKYEANMSNYDDQRQLNMKKYIKYIRDSK